MIPCAAVIPGPRGGIPLGAGIRGARQHEGPFFRLQLAQSLVGRSNVLHPVHIVDGAMVEGGAIVEAVNGVERHGLIGAFEQRRFIHIVPEARRPHAHEVFVEPAPPVSNACQGKIRKHTWARPNDANINRPIGIFHEHIVLHPRIVGRVTVVGIFFYVQVGDQDGVHALGAKVGNHLFESRKVFPVDGEWCVNGALPC